MQIQKISNANQNYRLNNYKFNNNKVNDAQNNVSFTSLGDFYASKIQQKAQYKQEFAQRILSQEQDIVAFLDELTFKYGENESASITDVLKELLSDDIEEIFLEGLMHRTMEENVGNILENGFDFSKIAKTNYGPGVYFANSEGAIQIYSGKTLQADFNGRAVRSEGLKNYNTFSNIVENELRKFLNMDMSFNFETGMIEHEVFSDFLNQYFREKIVNELNIDGAIALGSEGYFVIFNPDSIKNIRCH